MKHKWCILGGLAVALCTMSPVLGYDYLTKEEYNDILTDNYSEDSGIVVENHPELGYLTYKNVRGELITCNYYTGQVVVEKQPYYEGEDRIGYLDELFPNFEYDARDISITSIQAGDCIYIKKDKQGIATYISASNDYFMRYGKVISFKYNTGQTALLEMEDEKGKLYVYEVPITTAISKGNKSCTLNTLQVGDWVKVLVDQRILGQGILDEKVLEIVIDNNTRVISNIYKGQVTSIDQYKKLLNLKNAQVLQKNVWGKYSGIKSLAIEPKSVEAYRIGNSISVDYINRNLLNAEGCVYVAAEKYKGKENAIKLNFQSSHQRMLQPSLVISANKNSVRLLSGEVVYISEDSILIRDNRMITGSEIMVGDYLQAVVTGENKLAVGRIEVSQGTEALQVYRGRIKKVKDNESFEVETFSLLEGSDWYYHPTPQTFTVDRNTKFYNTSGLVENGLESFLGYGESSVIGEVVTVAVIGEKAYGIYDMDYAKESIKGKIYKVEENKVLVKDVYYQDRESKKWMQYSKKNVGGTVLVEANSLVIKEGKVIPISKLEIGDTIRVMSKKHFKDEKGTISAAIMVVED